LLLPVAIPATGLKPSWRGTATVLHNIRLFTILLGRIKHVKKLIYEYMQRDPSASISPQRFAAAFCSIESVMIMGQRSGNRRWNITCRQSSLFSFRRE
jgi:hypothetical protein